MGILDGIPLIGGKKTDKWISKHIKEIMGVRAVKDNSVYLNDGRVISLLRANPINIGFLDEKGRDAVIYGFLSFLNTLDFNIQVIVRSVNLDLDGYLDNLRDRILARDDKTALAYYEHYSEYLRNFLSRQSLRTQVFYIIVPAQGRGEGKETLKGLDERTQFIMDHLSVSGIVTERLDNNQLINFYSSYFTQTFNVAGTFISPQVMHKRMWRESATNISAPKNRKKS